MANPCGRDFHQKRRLNDPGNITTVKELLGHKTLTMTLRYAHLAPAHKARAVEILEENLGLNSTIQKLYNFKKKRLRPTP
ncbi:MAG: hypothetical protein ACE5DW_06185 [Thermodesulfobacteriota bacterium]